MRINEIFLSCQGEGPDVGIPTVFVRFQKCNVNCRWCDSQYTWGKDGEELTVDEIMSQVMTKDKYQCNHVYLTGGEPLIRDVSILVRKLKEASFSITIATNGTLRRPTWWKKVIWDADCKCPSSGVSEFDWSWASIGRKNRLKFVVADEVDLDFVVGMIPDLYGPLCPTLLVSPMNPSDTDTISQPWLQTVWEFCIKYNLRYSYQAHKVVFGNKRGV